MATIDNTPKEKKTFAGNSSIKRLYNNKMSQKNEKNFSDLVATQI